MATTYVRDVPEGVAAALRRRAAAQGQSLSAHLVTELTRLAARPTNAEIAARLRAQDRAEGPSRQEILSVLDASRQ